MSGEVPPSSKLRRSIGADIDDACELYENFTGHEPEDIQEVDISIPKAGIIVGRLDGILYTTVRDGKEESYIHEFEGDDPPLLIASADGESLLIVGEGYEFTERGIEDR